MNSSKQSLENDNNERSARSYNKNSHISGPPPPNVLSHKQNPQHPSDLYLKDSKIKDVRNADYLRKTAPSMENVQDPGNSHGYSSSHSDYSSSRPRYPYETDYNRQRFSDKKYQSLDERQYYSDRERSRPPSRSSLDERSEDYRYPPKPAEYPYGPNDDRRRGPPEYGRPPSRMSETDLSRPDRHGQYDYYKQQPPYSGPYSRNQDYYQRPPNYRGK